MFTTHYRWLVDDYIEDPEIALYTMLIKRRNESKQPKTAADTSSTTTPVDKDKVEEDKDKDTDTDIVDVIAGDEENK